MSIPVRKITLSQHHNPHYSDLGLPSDDKEPYVFRVETTQNLIRPAIGAWLRPLEVEDLITANVTVQIKAAHD